LLALACTSQVMEEPDPDPDPDPTDEDCDMLLEREMVPPSEVVPARVGELRDGELVLYDEDPTALFRWGFQGGTMIVPVVEVPASAFGDERCVEVQLTNVPDPDAPGEIAAGSFERFTWRSGPMDRTGGGGELEAFGDLLRTPELQNQIGWDDPTGTRLTLEVLVRGTTFVAETSVDLEVVSDDPDVCRDLVTEGGGAPGSCSYRLVPGTVDVGEHEAPADPCDPVSVDISFTPDDPATEACFPYADETYTFPHAACLDALEGPLPATLRSIVSGGCVPVMMDIPCDSSC